MYINLPVPLCTSMLRNIIVHRSSCSLWTGNFGICSWRVVSNIEVMSERSSASSDNSALISGVGVSSTEALSTGTLVSVTPTSQLVRRPLRYQPLSQLAVRFPPFPEALQIKAPDKQMDDLSQVAASDMNAQVPNVAFTSSAPVHVPVCTCTTSCSFSPSRIFYGAPPVGAKRAAASLELLPKSQPSKHKRNIESSLSTGNDNGAETETIVHAEKKHAYVDISNVFSVDFKQGRAISDYKIVDSLETQQQPTTTCQCSSYEIPAEPSLSSLEGTEVVSSAVGTDVASLSENASNVQNCELQQVQRSTEASDEQIVLLYSDVHADTAEIHNNISVLGMTGIMPFNVVANEVDVIASCNPDPYELEDIENALMMEDASNVSVTRFASNVDVVHELEHTYAAPASAGFSKQARDVNKKKKKKMEEKRKWRRKQQKKSCLKVQEKSNRTVKCK